VTTVAVIAAIVLGAWLLIEGALYLLVRALRPGFQWLIRPADAAPAIDPELVRQHMQRSFDPELGWVRPPDSMGADKGDGVSVPYRIDSRGCRFNPGFDGKPSEVAVFGDSFAFCRLVPDGETWPHYLSAALGTNVRNFGMGNYGVDQALLRFERELPRLDSRIVVMNIVHESVARVHSYWKHYFEYGNVLAFKPRFELKEGRLVHHAPAMRTAEDFANYRAQLGRIQGLDRFYRAKFSRDLLAFPYLPKLIRRWNRHVPILFHLAIGALTGRRAAGRRKAIGVIAKENGRVTAAMFADAEARALLTEVLRRFAERCTAAGRIPLLVVLPQPVDAEWRATGRDASRAYFAELAGILPVLDLTDTVLRWPSWRALFVGGPDGLGPHFTAEGNKAVADAVARRIAELRTAPANAGAPPGLRVQHV
jgi:hypothetical protein